MPLLHSINRFNISVPVMNLYFWIALYSFYRELSEGRTSAEEEAAATLNMLGGDWHATPADVVKMP